MSPPGLDEDLVQRLPLPLAQLYRRAHNAKSAQERHHAAYYLWEAALKLLGSAAVAGFLETGRTPEARLAAALENLARPAVGHWWEIVRLLTVELAEADPRFAAARDLLLGRARDDLPRAAGLDAALLAALDGKGGSRSSVRLTELFDRLVRYRNREFGHGAVGQRSAGHYEELGRALLAGVPQVLGRLDVLAGRRLVYLADLRRLATGAWLVERYELAGETPRRLESLEASHEEAAGLVPQQVYLAGKALHPLHPLVAYDPEANEFLFLNARRCQRRVEYLCYTSGRHSDRVEPAAQNALLAGLLDVPVDDARREEFLGRSQAEEGPAPAAEEPLRRLGEFELLSELGRGGMGVVYRAWQPSLGRLVALKCLLRAGDARAEARFSREIAALGRVEHPHLVRIFTSAAEGDRWFYGMELVEGATLAAVCARLQGAGTAAGSVDLATWQRAVSTACDEARRSEKPLSESTPGGGGVVLGPPAEGGGPAAGARAAGRGTQAGRGYARHVVGLVRQVAEAAHALHEKGIIHRDVKPDNVMVGSDGAQAVLMDLGLAQVADEVEGRLTRTRQFVGTLRYASPQQVLAVARLDRRTDVYSLGATLWELLALRPLYGATDATPTPELMERIQRDEPERLGRVCPGADRDLEAVVHKCLEKSPDKRYTTAAELARDLRRWLEGEVVQARRVRGWERAAKWARRRPAVAALLALVALVGAAGLGGIAWAYGRAVQERDHARSEAGRADEEARRARDAERSAAAQRQLALRTVRGVVGDIQAKLKGRPGQAGLRKALLGRALAGLKEVARAADTAAQADHETIQVYWDLGDIFLEIEEGGTAEAKKQYQAAHDLASRLAEADPGSAIDQRDLSVSYTRLGDVYLELGDSKAALEAYQKALEGFQRLALSDPASAGAQRDLSVSHTRLGDVYLELGDGRAALDAYRKALEGRQRLAEAGPGSASAERDLFVGHSKLGDVYLELGDSKAALEAYRMALEVSQRLAQLDRASAGAQRDLSNSHTNLGDVYLKLGDGRAALEAYQKALTVDERLARADPANAGAQRDLLVSYSKLGNVYLGLGDSKAALDAYHKALEVSQRLAKADPASAQAQRDLSVSHEKVGDVYLKLGDGRAALDAYQKSLEVRQRLARADPTSATAQRDLLVIYIKLGDCEQRAGEFTQAADWYTKALDIPKRFPRPGSFKQEVDEVEGRLRVCRAAAAALADPAVTLKQPEELRGPVLSAVTIALARGKEPGKAAATADLLAANAKGPGDLYNAACGYALCVPLAGDPGTKEKYAARAINLLRQAIARGYKDTAHLKEDTDLAALRERDDFKKLLAEVAAKAQEKRGP
jgi:serine/threonine-protein kinase